MALDFTKYKNAIAQLSTSDNQILSTATTMQVKLADENGEELLFTIINKNISTPIGMKDILVQGDKLSRRIFFEMNRYFDGVDLSTKKFFINFVNASNQSGTDNIVDLYVTDATITFEWWIPGELTILDGEVTIQLEIADFDDVGDIVYRYMTTPLPIQIEKSIIPTGIVDQNDYYLDISFLNKYTEDINYNIASDLEAIRIENRSIIMPYLEDLVVTQDSRSKILTFIIDRYFDNVDFSTKTIVIKFQLPDGQGDRSYVCNTAVSDTKIRFDWLLDSKVTLLEGKVTFSIEFIGYNEKNEFTCWNTLSSSLFVSKGLEVDTQIEQPTASWIQSWNILADKYLRNFLKYMNMMEELSSRMEVLADEIEKAKKKTESAANSAKIWSDIAWNQADRADQIKTEVLILKADFDKKKADFDIKYKKFDDELPNLRKKTDLIEYKDLATTLAMYIDGKSNSGHTHNVNEITDARSKNEPITEDDLSIELIEKINSGGVDDGSSDSSGSGSSGISISNIFNDNIVSANKGWTSNKVNAELSEIKSGFVQKDAGKGLSDNNFSDYYRKKIDSIEENANYFDVTMLQNVPLALFKQDNLHRTLTDAEIITLKDKYTKSETDNLISSISTGLSWKEPVITYNELLTKYTNPANGDTANVENDPDKTKNGTYTFSEDINSWIQISSSFIPVATTSSDGLMSKRDKVILDEVKSFVDNYKEPEVTTDTIAELSNEITNKLNGYRKKDILIMEDDIDPELIKKLSVADISLINDTVSTTDSVYSSAKTDGVIDDAINNVLNNEVTENDVAIWFSEIDDEFAW